MLTSVGVEVFLVVALQFFIIGHWSVDLRSILGCRNLQRMCVVVTTRSLLYLRGFHVLYELKKPSRISRFSIHKHTYLSINTHIRFSKMPLIVPFIKSSLRAYCIGQ